MTTTHHTPSKRPHQVADLVQQIVAMALLREVADPRLAGVNITSVDVSPDLRHAKVFFMVRTDEEREPAEAALLKAAGFLRHRLAKETRLRYAPTLRFVYDASTEYGEKMVALIQVAVPSDEPVDSSSHN